MKFHCGRMTEKSREKTEADQKLSLSCYNVISRSDVHNLAIFLIFILVKHKCKKTQLMNQRRRRRWTRHPG